MTEAELSKLQDAKIAEALKPQLFPILDEIEKGVLGRLKGLHRARSMRHEDAISAMAELCLLEELKDGLTSKINRVQKIREELANGSSK